ncbi:extracellular solute-binding protein [uncultured Martelella sp.]|uniref:ABC transporter substrate-binding protein n=1 Tax=uncultured Martelella sp. TaxID=392331 RepID=UPI0029C9079A|nr:extracellular solute-binding protein [uncultured Martelella sp.]
MLNAGPTTMPVWQDLIDQYKDVAPDVTINVNQVGYNVIRDQLPIQLEAGTGPDLATVTNLGGLNPYYLDLTPYVDAEQWERNYGDTLRWYRAGKTGGIYGWQTDLSVSGPYINRTLFEEAGVEIPEPGATWDDWADATGAVQGELGLYAGMVMDRSGHRFAGPAMSYGAQYVDENGNLVVDEGFRAFSQRMLDWHETGLMPPDIWPAVSGQTYADGNSLFFAEDVPFYMSGSWNLSTVENTVGDGFDWAVALVPCGPEGCGVMPGGGGLVSFADTEHPEEVAAFIDWMASNPVARQFYTRTFQIPANQKLQEEGLDYGSAGASEKVQDALNLFGEMAATSARETPQAFRIQGDNRSSAMFSATADYLGAAMNGEFTLDEALDKIREAIAQNEN